MIARLGAFLARFSLAQQFMLANLFVLLAGMFGVGWWLSEQTKQVVVSQVAAETALYVDTFVAQYLQDFQPGTALPAARIAELDQVLVATPLKTQIVKFKVWDAQGLVIYSSDHTLIGQRFPVKDELALSIQGTVTADVSNLADEENVAERGRWSQLLEIYSPLKRAGDGQVVAVAEFYQTVDTLNAALREVQTATWLALGVVTLVIYLLLAIIVQRGSDTIDRQKAELNRQVAQMYATLAQNELLHERVRRAAAGAAAVNERFLRRIGSELHDGPVQDLSLALLELDQQVDAAPERTNGEADTGLPAVQRSVRAALQELRAIASGLGLPQLNTMSLADTLQRVVYVHQRRTRTVVELDLADLPEQAPLVVKNTLYRVTQEALANAARHAQGKGQRVRVRPEAYGLRLEVADAGPGYDVEQTRAAEGHLGVWGMRERVESLGGLFEIQSTPGQGTVVSVYIPMRAADKDYD